jgi:hypothetical protein
VIPGILLSKDDMNDDSMGLCVAFGHLIGAFRVLVSPSPQRYGVALNRFEIASP